MFLRGTHSEVVVFETEETYRIFQEIFDSVYTDDKLVEDCLFQYGDVHIYEYKIPLNERRYMRLQKELKQKGYYMRQESTVGIVNTIVEIK